MYEDGYGVSQNHIYAYMWFSVAALQSDKDAVKVLVKATRYLTTDQLKMKRNLTKNVSARHTEGVKYKLMIEEKSQQKIGLLQILTERCRKHPARRALRAATQRCHKCVLVWNDQLELNNMSA